MEFGVLRHRLQARARLRRARVRVLDACTATPPRSAPSSPTFARRAVASGRVHLVGHSLGGAIRVSARCRTAASARAATPCCWLAAQWQPRRERRRCDGRCCGRCSGRTCRANSRSPAGVAGRRTSPRARRDRRARGRLGTGQFFAHFDDENDGTVAVSETVIPGLDGPRRAAPQPYRHAVRRRRRRPGRALPAPRSLRGRHPEARELGVRPAAAQGAVELDVGAATGRSWHAHQVDLGVEELALGIEHLEIAHDAGPVAHALQAQHFARGIGANRVLAR